MFTCGNHSLTDSELLNLYATEPDAALADAERRDQADAARARRRSDPLTAEWCDAAHAQDLAAEAACNGELVRDAQHAPFCDAFALWSGSDQFAQRWAVPADSAARPAPAGGMVSQVGRRRPRAFRAADPAGQDEGRDPDGRAR